MECLRLTLHTWRGARVQWCLEKKLGRSERLIIRALTGTPLNGDGTRMQRYASGILIATKGSNLQF